METAELSYAKRLAVDSTISAQVKSEAAKLDTYITRRGKSLVTQKQGITSATLEYAAAKKIYAADTSGHHVASDSALHKADKVITAQQQYTDSLERQNADNAAKAALYIKTDSVKTTTINAANTLITTLKKQAQRSWFERHKGGICFGGGVVVSVAAIYFISRLH